MSAIGTSNYFVVGYFQGVPVYQPLWRDRLDMQPHDMRDANMEPGQLVIGGGSGEHPAIIFRDVESCVAKVLCSKWSPVLARPMSDITKAAEPMESYASGLVEFCQWDCGDYRRFHKRCEFDYSFFANENAFREQDEEVFSDEEGREVRNDPETTLELWLCLNIGEFVYAALPSLTQNIQCWRNALGPVQHAWFRGVLVAPPGYPDEGGRPENEQATEPDIARTHGGAPRFSVVDRFPGYHRNPEY